MYSFSVPFLEQSQQTKTELPTGIQRLNALDKNNSRELRDRAERGQESSFL
jgi:hypothetical protein